MFLSFREFGSTSKIPSFPLAASFFKGAKASSALTLVLNFSRKSAIILPGLQKTSIKISFVWVVYLLLHYTSSCSSSSFLNVIVLKNEKRFIIVVSYMREVAVIIISLSQPYEWTIWMNPCGNGGCNSYVLRKVVFKILIISIPSIMVAMYNGFN